ncbi:MAG: hypothetical protein JOZ07_14405 [Solirubrobacterales bacterium]|nr:hypothetical protein [Solirubrobacterales bacterium]
MANPWLAIDVATAPAQRAREVRRAWERFVGGGGGAASGSGRSSFAGDPALREPIRASWRRSAAAGVDPSGSRRAPVVADADETTARWEVHPLADMAPLINDCLAATADESRHLIVVSDANGMLLWVAGNATVRLRAADSMNFAEGTLWSECGAGTNAIGTALAAQHAVQVFAAEHFSECVQGWTCAAAPVSDPDTGRVIGVIDLTGEMSTVHPHSMAVATATAQAVEAHLRCEMLDRDARLISRHGDQLAAGGDPRALVAPSGRVVATRPVGWLGAERLLVPPGGGQVRIDDRIIAIAEPLGHEDAYLLRALTDPAAGRAQPAAAAQLRLALLGRDGAVAQLSDGGAARAISLRLRHAEILALLGAHPHGLSSEELSRGVYGDESRVGAVRVEISRLRKLLGDCIDAELYALAPGVVSDVGQVVGLLHRGRIREAAVRYPGPLLPRSRAPGVAAERDALEEWMRRSVLSSGDQEALWAWLQTPSGEVDLAAWRRLLAALAFADPRRSLAASRIARLRAGGASVEKAV